MGRTISEIQQSLIDAKNADPELSALDNDSDSAVWLLWTWIYATCASVTEALLDTFKAAVLAMLNAMKPHTLQWYVTKAKAFQFGYDLPADTDVYDVIDASAQVVSFASVVELPNQLRIKGATGSVGSLAALSSAELTSWNAYMGRIKDAGVRVICTSGAPDTLRLNLKIYFDPLILDDLGRRLDGSADTPVIDAANAFIDSLPFDGVFIVNKLIAAITSVEGVIICEVDYCAAQYGLLSYSNIVSYYTPDAGYMVLDSAYFTTNTTYAAYGIL